MKYLKIPFSLNKRGGKKVSWEKKERKAIPVGNVIMWKLNPVIWRDIIEVNMKEWGTPAISVNTLLLKQVIWRSSYDLWSDIQTNLQLRYFIYRW